VFGDISEATITSKAYIDVVRQPFVFSIYIAYVSSQRLGAGKRKGLPEHEFMSGFLN